MRLNLLIVWVFRVALHEFMFGLSAVALGLYALSTWSEPDPQAPVVSAFYLFGQAPYWAALLIGVAVVGYALRQGYRARSGQAV